MAGFPDDHGTWDEIAPRFASTCTVVSMVMPDYDTGSLARYWGHSLPQIADMLEATLSDVVPDGDKATLVAHDWGAAVAMMYLKRPQALGKVDRLVLMDVGPSPDRSFRNAVAILTYQTYLSLAFLVGRCTLDIFGEGAAADLFRFLLRAPAAVAGVRWTLCIPTASPC